MKITLLILLLLSAVYGQISHEYVSELKELCAAKDYLACNVLGYIYENELETEHTKKLALDFYRKACDLKYEAACRNYIRLKEDLEKQP